MEAAILLYFGAEKEYKQAKMKAAKNCGARILPTNLEVALELDRIAEQNEGASRHARLILMRKEALKIMKLFNNCHPLLIGSVWRGTIRRGSDIDIALYSDSPEEIMSLVQKNGWCVSSGTRVAVTKKGQAESSYHINSESSNGCKIEIVVRDRDKAQEKRRCEVYGDIIKGLTIHELENVLAENPLRQFVPS